MTYKDCIDYIYSFINKDSNKKKLNTGSNAHLNNTIFLLEKLGYKQTFKVIHITGTKGKGSTTLSLARMIEGVGFNVGAFVSPHIIDIRERISINGEWISEDDIVIILEKIKNIIDNNTLETEPTFFEFFTVISLYYFYQKKVDYACIEVGIGGLLDATNIVSPLACIITSISYDHVDILGNSLRDIAIQKAGIIKNNIDVISVGQANEVLDVLKNKVIETSSRLHCLGTSYFYKVLEDSPNGLKFLYSENSENNNYEAHFNLSLRGFYQAENVSSAYKTFRIIFRNECDDFFLKAIKKVESLTIKARLTFVSVLPPIIVDGAHNGLSLERVLKTVFSWYDYLIILFAPLSDKDIVSMCNSLKEYKCKMSLIVSSPSQAYKNRDSLKVYEYLKSIDVHSLHIENIYEAIDYMKLKAKEENKASLVIGSLYSASNYLLDDRDTKS